ncbi:MAG: hypothetical protein ACOYMF_19525 [Bacteroidales bacterium]
MKIKFLIPVSLIGLMFACAPTTKLDTCWADPSFNATTVKPFTKVLVIAPIKDVNTQRITEDKIVLNLKQGVGVQSYRYLLPADTTKAALENKLKNDGFDGVILMHLKEVEKSTSYTPGTSYGGYYGGYGGYGYGGYGYRGYGGYGGGYTEGYYSEDKTFRVETNLYSVSESKLLWTGSTSSLNPTSLDQTLDQIIMAIKNELRKKGLIKK